MIHIRAITASLLTAKIYLSLYAKRIDTLGRSLKIQTIKKNTKHTDQIYDEFTHYAIRYFPRFKLIFDPSFLFIHIHNRLILCSFRQTVSRI